MRKKLQYVKVIDLNESTTILEGEVTKDTTDIHIHAEVHKVPDSHRKLIETYLGGKK